MFALLDKLNLDKDKIIAVLIATVLVAVLDIMFVIGPQSKANGNMAKEIRKMRTDIAAMNRDLNLAQQQQKTMAKEQEGQPAQRKIYSTAETPQLLQDISRMATEKNVSIKQITPLKEPQGKASGMSGDFVGLKIRLSMECGYHGLGAFLNGMENSRQPLFAEEIQIIGNPDNHLKSTVNMVVKTYVKK